MQRDTHLTPWALVGAVGGVEARAEGEQAANEGDDATDGRGAAEGA